MEKIIIITPHLSTGGLPQVIVKQIELLKNDYELHLIEYADVTGGNFVVQRNRVLDLIDRDKFYSLGENKLQEIKDIINTVKPSIIHLQEIPELSIDFNIAEWIYRSDRPYKIVETTHSADFDITTKRFLPDKFNFVSYFNALKYINFDIPFEVIEYPVEKRERNQLDAQKQLGLDPSYYHVICVGLFTPRKNQGYIFDIAKHFEKDRIKFHFIGNQADNFKYYWEPIMKTKSDNCLIHGERSDVDKWYEACDLMVFPSIGPGQGGELNPIVVKEALEWDIEMVMFKLPVYMGKYDNNKSISFFNNNIEDDVKTIKKIFQKGKDGINYDTSFTFDAESKLEENRIYVTYHGKYPKYFKMSIKDIDSHLPIYSVDYMPMSDGVTWWITPIQGADYLFNPKFHGYLLEWYDPHTMELLYSKECRARDGKPAIDTVFKCDPMDATFLNYTEFFYRDIYRDIDISNSNVVFDIGANSGVWTAYALSKGCKNIYSFEPIQKAYQSLYNTFGGDGRVTCINKAIDTKSGNRTMFTTKDNSTISSFYETQADYVPGYKDKFIPEEIQTITIDDVIKQYGITKIDLFKTDIEGFEYELFQNMSPEVLKMIDKMIIEFHVNFNGEVKPLIKKLEDNGFIIKHIRQQVWDYQTPITGSTELHGGILIVERDKLPEECFVSTCTENYLPLAERLVKSLNEFSDKKIVFYGINCDLPFSYPNLIKKRIDIDNSLPEFIDAKKVGFDDTDMIIELNEDSIGYVNRNDLGTYETLSKKLDIVLQTIDDGIKKAIFLDCDGIANTNIDDLFDTKHTENYPLVGRGLNEYLVYGDRHVWKSGEFKIEDSIEYPLMELANVKDRSMFYVCTNVFMYTDKCKDFFTECKELSQHPNIITNVGHYAPFQDETIINVILWKWGATKHLPVVHFNLIDYSWLKTFENETRTNYMYETRWQFIPENKNDIKFFHGCKSVSELDKCINHLAKNLNKLNISDTDAYYCFSDTKKSEYAVVTLFNDNYFKLAGMSLNNKKEYCKKHGYDLIYYDKNLVSHLPVQWSKIEAVRRNLKNYKGIMWIDIDTLIMDMDVKLEHFLSDGYNISMATDVYGHDNILSGTFIINNTPIGNEFLEDWIGLKKDYLQSIDVNIFDHEQQALRLMYKNDEYYYGIMPKNPRELGTYWYTDNLKVLDYYPDWNTNFQIYKPGDFIIHFCGMDVDDRYKNMKMFYERNNNN